MAIPDNYSIIQVVSTDATIRVDVEWDFDSLAELYIWIQNNTDGTLYRYTDGDFVVTKGEDGTGVFLTVENPTEVDGVYSEVTVKTARLSPKVQNYDLKNNQALDAVALVEAFDDIVKMIQEIAVGYEYDQQAITSVNPFVIADKANRKGVFLAFDENGDIDLTIETDDIKALLVDFDTAVREKADEIVPEAVDDYLQGLDIYDDTFEVADITARDALTPKKSDVAVVADNGTGKPSTYMYNGSAWVEIAKTATAEVTQAEFLVVKDQVDEVFTDVGGTPADGVDELSQAFSRYVAGGATYQAGGTANAITLSSYGARQGVSTMPEGAVFRFLATATNTASVTVNVQGIGAKTIRKDGFSSNLDAGDIVSGKVYEIFYNSSVDQFELLNLTSEQTDGGTVLTTVDMTNGGADDLNNIDVLVPSTWSDYDYVEFHINNCKVNNDGQMAFALSSDGGSSWVGFSSVSQNSLGWTDTLLGGSPLDEFSGKMRLDLRPVTKLPLCYEFSAYANGSIVNASANFYQGFRFNYNGISLTGTSPTNEWNAWYTGSSGLNGYTIRFTHEVGNFTSGTLKVIGYKYP